MGIDLGSTLVLAEGNTLSIMMVLLSKPETDSAFFSSDHKVTTHGEPVLNLECGHRKPYEGILIGTRMPSVNTDTSAITVGLPNVDEKSSSSHSVKKRLLVSVPSQHSRKPSIAQMLENEFLASSEQSNLSQDKEPRRLELFARNLEGGFVSWGNEPIRYQYCGRGHASGQPDIQDGFLVPVSRPIVDQKK